MQRTYNQNEIDGKKPTVFEWNQTVDKGALAKTNNKHTKFGGKESISNSRTWQLWSKKEALETPAESRGNRDTLRITWMSWVHMDCVANDFEPAIKRQISFEYVNKRENYGFRSDPNWFEPLAIHFELHFSLYWQVYFSVIGRIKLFERYTC